MATWQTQEWSAGRCTDLGDDLEWRLRSGTDSLVSPFGFVPWPFSLLAALYFHRTLSLQRGLCSLNRSYAPGRFLCTARYIHKKYDTQR